MKLSIAMMFLVVWFFFYGLLIDMITLAETGLHYGELFTEYYAIYGVDAIGVVFLYYVPRLLLLLPISVPVVSGMFVIYICLIDFLDDFLGKYGDIGIVEFIKGKRDE